MKQLTYILALAFALSGVSSASAQTTDSAVAPATNPTTLSPVQLRAKAQAERELRQTNTKKIIGERKDTVGAVRVETKEKNASLRQENKALIQSGVKENKDAITENRAEIKDNWESARNEVKDVRTDAKTKLQAEKERAQAVRSELKAEFQTKLETQKTEMAERHEAQKKAVEVKKLELKEKMADKKAALTEQKQKRVQEFLDKTAERFEAAIERLNELATRIDSRIAKFDELGVNTTDIKSALATAREQIASAQAKIGSVTVSSVEVVEGETPKDAFATVKTGFDEAKQTINDAHASLVKVVEMLKVATPKTTVPVESSETETENE